MIRRPARALLAAAALAVGCTPFEVTRCGDQVCPGELACCGTVCVLPTCGDGVRDPGEQCDTWTRQACTSAGFDFGQIGCTATCGLDERPCARFGFDAGGLPCEIARPTQLAVADGTLWVGTQLKLAVRADAAGCTSATLAAVPSRLLAISATEAIAVYTTPPAVQVVTPDGVRDVPGTVPFAQAAAVVDDRRAVLGHGGGLLTVVERGATGWTARPVTLTCGAGGVGRVDAVARLGDQLVVVFAATVPKLGTVPLVDLAGTTATAACADLLGLPPNPDFNASPVGGGRLYLVGNATVPGVSVTGIVVEVEARPGGGLATTIRRGADGDDGAIAHLPPLAPLQRAWLDPGGALHVTSGSNAMVLRDQRWRRLDDPIARGFGATVAFGETSVTATTASALVSHGHGFEVVDDLGTATHPARCAPTATTCAVAAVGRARGAAWMLVASVAAPVTTWTVARDGLPIERTLAGTDWAPQALAFGADAEWIVAALPGRDQVYLWRTIDDPAPALVAAGCDVAAIDLDVGLTQVVVASQVGGAEGAPCARSSVVTRRRVADDAVATLWTTPAEVLQVAAPADGADTVLALVVDRDPGGAVTGHRLLELDGAGAVRERAAWAGAGVLHALWAEDRDHAWLVGDHGRVLRFTGEAVSDESAALGDIGGATLRAVAGTGPADVFLGGDANVLFHFDGQAWTSISPSSQLESMAALALDGADVYLAADDRAVALRVPRVPPSAAVCTAP